MKTLRMTRFATPIINEAGKVTGMTPGSFIFTEDPVPEIRDDQVLLKILYVGVCGSDLQQYHGLHPAVTQERLPHVPGHEASARVVKTGALVKDFHEGELVAIEPQITCGKCWPCLQGRFNVCEHLSVLGAHQSGLLCEYYACSPRLLHHTPPGLDPELAALTEPLAVGVGAVRRSRMLPGGNVVIVGAGTIGNCVIQAARNFGAGKILAADINKKKLELALECGAYYIADLTEISLRDAVIRSFGSVRKADVIMDCAASPSAFEAILEASRPNSEIIITGNYKTPVSIEFPWIQRREVQLTGHMMYVREDYQAALRLLAEHRIHTEKLISQRWSFEQYPQALIFADEHPLDVMKMMIRIS